MPQDWKELLKGTFAEELANLEPEPEPEVPAPVFRKQRLVVTIDRRRRAGKQVTLKAEGGEQSVVGWSFVRVNNDDTTDEYTVSSAEYTFEMPVCKSLTVNAVFGTTGIGSLTSDSPSLEEKGSWYDLSGRRLTGKPAHSGLYIHDGRRVVFK